MLYLCLEREVGRAGVSACVNRAIGIESESVDRILSVAPQVGGPDQACPGGIQFGDEAVIGAPPKVFWNAVLETGKPLRVLPRAT